MSENNRLSFFRYLSYKKGWIGLFVVFNIIFVITYYVQFKDLKQIIYEVFLTTICLVVYLAYDYYMERDRLHKLTAGKIKNKFFSKHPTDELLLEEIFRLEDQIREKESNDKKDLQALVEYYTVWTHQIKTPISAIYLLLAEDKPSKKDIQIEVFKIEEYVNMLIGYLRLNTKSTDYLFETFSLDKLVRGTIRKYSNQFIKLKLAVEYEASDIEIKSDFKWLSFALDQILSNSIKYTKEGKVSIYVENNKLIIQDTGIGIASQDLPRITEMGYTGYNGRINKKSTGIGLYLVSRILEEFSIDLKIESELGKGTKVILIFPYQNVVD